MKISKIALTQNINHKLDIVSSVDTIEQHCHPQDFFVTHYK